MSEIITGRIEDFKNRLNEIGLSDKVKFTESEKIPFRYTVELIEGSSRESFCFMLMGLIAHFCNRKWCKDWSYMYILKSMHTITFTEESD